MLCALNQNLIILGNQSHLLHINISRSPSFRATSSSNMMAVSLMPISQKLTRNNHTLWCAQVSAVLQGAQFVGFLDGTKSSPAEKIQIKKQSDKEEEVEEVSNPAFEL
jgi:hypothetical protein